MKTLKTCATCRHLGIVDEGYEVAGLLDTAYIETRCSLLGWMVKEHYLLPYPKSQEGELRECSYWEYWAEVERLQGHG